MRSFFTLFSCYAIFATENATTWRRNIVASGVEERRASSPRYRTESLHFINDTNSWRRCTRISLKDRRWRIFIPPSYARLRRCKKKQKKKKGRENVVPRVMVFCFHAGGTLPNVTPEKRSSWPSLIIVETSQRRKNLVILEAESAETIGSFLLLLRTRDNNLLSDYYIFEFYIMINESDQCQ